MLKKIPVDHLRLGMHLHKLEGSWLDHPFWKARFIITSEADLASLRTGKVAECWIDTALGLDLEPPGAPPSAPPPLPETPAPAPAPPPPPPPPDGPPPPGPGGASARLATTPLAEEIKQAAAICQRGRQAVVAMFREARLGRVVDAQRCLPLVEEIADSVQRNAGALVSLARLKSKDDYTYMHSVAVCAMMVALARQLGMDDASCRVAGAAGLMHDIGKALMPTDILNKPGALTPGEFEVIRGHPERGHAMLHGAPGVLESTLDVVLHHHEKVNGTGYPHRLAGEAITQLARMGAVCDVYDAVTSNRPYKAGWDPAESIARMASWKGHFDPAIFSAFVQSLGIYPTGSVVRLESERLAMVIEQNPGNLMAPVVKAFFSTKWQMYLNPVLVDLSQRKSKDRIVAREADAHSKHKNLDELWADPSVLRRLGV